MYGRCQISRQSDDGQNMTLDSNLVQGYIPPPLMSGKLIIPANGNGKGVYRYTLRFPAPLHRQVKDLSGTQVRSFNQQVIYLLERAIKLEEREARQEAKHATD